MARWLKGPLTKKQRERRTEARRAAELGKDNYGRPRKECYDKLAAMTDDELFEETKKYIWLSAYAGNNPRSDYHWQCDACSNVWDDRNKVQRYAAAYKEVEQLVG